MEVLNPIFSSQTTQGLTILSWTEFLRLLARTVSILLRSTSIPPNGVVAAKFISVEPVSPFFIFIFPFIAVNKFVLHFYESTFGGKALGNKR